MSHRLAIFIWIVIYALGTAVCGLTDALTPANAHYYVGYGQGAFTAIMWMLAWGFRHAPTPSKPEAA